MAARSTELFRLGNRPAADRAWGTALACWLIAVAAFFCWVVDHSLHAVSMRPDSSASPGAGEAAIQLADDGPTLLLFLYPKCSCNLVRTSGTVMLFDRHDAASVFGCRMCLPHTRTAQAHTDTTFGLEGMKR